MADFVGKQSNIDGMCGLYCLVNAIKSDPLMMGKLENDRARDALRYVLESAERLGLLTSYRMWSGYHWHELIEIFNHFSDRVRFPFRAISFEEMNEIGRWSSGVAMISHIVDIDGSAIISVDRGNHWVLVKGRQGDGEFSVVDPAPGSNRHSITRLVDRFNGVAILPRQEMK